MKLENAHSWQPAAVHLTSYQADIWTDLHWIPLTLCLFCYKNLRCTDNRNITSVVQDSVVMDILIVMIVMTIWIELLAFKAPNA